MMARSSHVALVTGGTKNIGAAAARALAADGHDVVVTSRAESEQGADLVTELEALGVRARQITCDVRDPESVRTLHDALDADDLRVDIVVNNASHRPHQAFLDITESDWQDVLGVTLGGAFRCTQRFAPQMIEQGWGRVVNLIGVRGQGGAADRAHLVAAKNGLIGLTRALAHDLGPSGVTVNAISPGTIATDRDVEDPARLRSRTGHGVLGRFGRPEDVGTAIAFLAGDDAAYITGQVIGVNGGELMA